MDRGCQLVNEGGQTLSCLPAILEEVVLGVEELDEALQEVWALLHLALSSFDKVLAKDKTKKCDVN